ncbi:MAG: PIN domain-containing protein [Thermoleophilia bacterium]|nr:PIN domain-containing protein [Thermoleophilia bacterium]
MIFADTSFWVALAAEHDQRHEDAKALLSSLRGDGLVTSNHVRGETWTFLRRRHGHAVAVLFLDVLGRTPRTALAMITSEQEEEALTWLRAHREREYSFVDATSFALMRSLGIHRAFAFDGDFTAAGFVEERPGRSG